MLGTRLSPVTVVLVDGTWRNEWIFDYGLVDAGALIELGRGDVAEPDRQHAQQH
jgi:hypothetical protein